MNITQIWLQFQNRLICPERIQMVSRDRWLWYHVDDDLGMSEGRNHMKNIDNYKVYEDEIDLREIFNLLIRRWRWIAAATILAAVMAVIVSFILPKEYQTWAYVTLTNPDTVFRFDPRITTEVEAPLGKGIVDLAMSDDVVQEILNDDRVTDLEPGEWSVDKFRERLDVSLTDSVLRLAIKDSDPERASTCANIWADAVSDQLNEIYSPSLRTTETFKGQVEDALAQWSKFQRAWIEFQETNPELILEQQLNDKSKAYSAYLESNRLLEILFLDAETLQLRLESRESEEGADLRDDIISLLLATRSLISDAPTPIEIQIVAQADTILNETSFEQAKYLDEIMNSLDFQRTFLQQKAAELESEFLTLQGELAQIQEEGERIKLEKDLAQDTFELLSRKYQEINLSVQDQTSVARVASQASVPTEKISPRTTLITITATAFVFILSVIGVVIIEWWKVDPTLS